MGLLQKLKSALGLDASGSHASGTTPTQDVDVTVEREPSSESEDAVKGTDTSAESAPGEATAAETSAETTETATEELETEATEAEAEASDAETESSETEEPVDEAESSDAGPEDTAAETDQADDGTDAGGAASVSTTEINGIGPAYADRLEAAGVESVADLADADAEELAEATDLSPNRISGWIDSAQSF